MRTERAFQALHEGRDHLFTGSLDDLNHWNFAWQLTHLLFKPLGEVLDEFVDVQLMWRSICLRLYLFCRHWTASCRIDHHLEDRLCIGILARDIFHFLNRGLKGVDLDLSRWVLDFLLCIVVKSGGLLCLLNLHLRWSMYNVVLCGGLGITFHYTQIIHERTDTCLNPWVGCI